MQNVVHNSNCGSVRDQEGKERSRSSSPLSGNISVERGPAAFRARLLAELSESEDDDVSEVESFILEQAELEDENVIDSAKYLLADDSPESCIDVETQCRLEALLEASGAFQFGNFFENGHIESCTGGQSYTDQVESYKLSVEAEYYKQFYDRDVLRRLNSSLSSVFDEAASASVGRMRSDQILSSPLDQGDCRSLAEACSDGDISTVKRLLNEGRNVNEVTEEGESLLSLACSSGYYELAQLLLAMKANIEDRGLKDTTPLMEAASAGYADIVKLLIEHGADVNAQTSQEKRLKGAKNKNQELQLKAQQDIHSNLPSIVCPEGNTPLMFAASAGHVEVARVLLDAGSSVEDHNENGHTPLMEAASAGHVEVAKLLVERGSCINTHSNEFKESALTLACYKGHLEMVRFLLEAGADQEHKTDEMHTALMEASMDGHVEVARLLLDSGAQVNMPADSFESPLTLAACGGHVELAMLLLERGANIEEVNDEGYTPLMEAAREGHEEMVALLLSQGADINSQTEETQETALTLACCGGFLEVADFLIKAGADIELGTSTPLMEASQEGHLELVRYLITSGANVNATSTTGDTALTYACENGHTDVADLLLQASAKLEHESEGGRTPLMKAARAGHLCTVQFLITKGSNVNKQTTNNDHNPLSLACAGGHLPIVELLLAHGADPTHKLKDNSTMLIEASKGGHTAVVQLLLDYPNSLLASPPPPPDLTQVAGQTVESSDAPRVPPHGLQVFSSPDSDQNLGIADSSYLSNAQSVPTFQDLVRDSLPNTTLQSKQKIFQRKLSNKNIDAPSSNYCEGLRYHYRSKNNIASQVSSIAIHPEVGSKCCETEHVVCCCEEGGGGGIDPSDEDFRHNDRLETCISTMMKKAELLNPSPEEQIAQKQHILEELQRVERELQDKASAETILLQQSPQHNVQGFGSVAGISTSKLEAVVGSTSTGFPTLGAHAQQFLINSGAVLDIESLSSAVMPDLTAHLGVNLRTSTTASGASACPSMIQQMTPQQLYQHSKQLQLQQQAVTSSSAATDHNNKPRSIKASKQAVLKQIHQQYYQLQQNQLQEGSKLSTQPVLQPQSLLEDMEKLRNAVLNDQQLQQNPGPLTNLQQQFLLSELMTQNFSLKTNSHLTEGTADALAIMQGIKLLPDGSPTHAIPIFDPLTEAKRQQQQPPFDKNVKILKGAAVKTLLQTQVSQPQQQQTIKHQLTTACGDACALVGNLPMDATGVLSLSGMAAPVFPVSLAMSPTSATAAAVTNCNEFREGFLKGLMVAAPARSLHETLGEIMTGPTTQLAGNQMHLTQQGTTTLCSEPCSGTRSRSLSMTSLPGVSTTSSLPLAFHSLTPSVPSCVPLQVATTPGDGMISSHHLPHIAHSIASTSPPTPPLYPPLDLNSQTDSNHDTALTLACAGGHEELVSLLLSRGADIEHRDKKGFTPLMLAATAGHAGVVEILLNHASDIEAQSERTKDTALSLACSGGRYEVVDILLARGANKEHRNVSDYTPLSLAASGGYVNIIKLLLSHGAEINSRTGSKLGISPLMLAAMNGHTQAVKLLLDMGSDINAQIETNRNTALTLACFQGRHEVVSLLLDRKANVEHRAKTGLTPLMEAASGGYVEVGKVLLDKGADVNAPPVPSSRDTALTIAADKGHYRFVELLLQRDAIVEVKNKKGNSPLWLSAHGGHIDVIQLLVNKSADIDSQDNRKVSCLMAAFRKGHLKTVKWMVKHVTQFPSDQEMVRYISTINDKDLLKKCHQCAEAIRVAKDRQAAEANKNANILLEELDQERSREECRKAAAARRRERKRRKKREKQEQLRAAKAAAEETKSSDKDCDPDVAQTQSDVEDDFDDDFEDEDDEDKKAESKPSDIDCGNAASNANARLLPDCPSPKKGGSLLLSNTSSAGASKSKESDSIEAVSSNPTKSGINSSKCTYSNTSCTTTTTATITTTTTTASSSSNSKKPDQDREKLKSQSRSSKKSTIVRSSHLDERIREMSKNLVNKQLSNAETVSGRNAKKRNQKSEALVVSGTSATVIAPASVPNVTVGLASVQHHAVMEKSHSNVPNIRHPKHVKEVMMNGVAGGSGEYDDLCCVVYPRGKGSKYSGDHKMAIDTYADLGIDLQTNDVTFPNLKSSATSSLVHNMKSPLAVGTSPKKWQKRDEGWKEVVRRKDSGKCNSISLYRSKKVSVPSSTISRVIGRGGCNINAIREGSGAHIEVEKQKGQGERTIIIRGSAESTRLAHTLITALIKEPEKELSEILVRCGLNRVGGYTAPFSNENVKSTFTFSSCAPVMSSQVSVSSTQSKGSSKAASVTRSSGILASAATKVTSIPPPSLPANSAPPFSHLNRSNLPGNQNIRASIPVGGSSMPPFLNSSPNAWTGVVVTGKVPSNVPRAVAPMSCLSTLSLTSVTTRVVATTTVEKSPVVRQLFPQEKIAASSSQQGSTTSTKTTVSYTMAVIAQGKAPKTVPTSAVTVATKTTTTAETKVSSVVSGAVERAGSAPPGSTAMTSHMTVGHNPGLSSVQPFSANQSSRPSAGVMLLQQATAAIPHLSRMQRCQAPSQSKPFVSSAPTSNLSSPTNNPPSTSASISTASAPTGTSSAQSAAAPEYSPFNNLFSQMAQPNVWGQKDKELAKPNFASVAAVGVTSVACPVQNTNPVQSTLTLSLPQNPEHELIVDAAKAPGYRGNLHISPSASSSSSASSIPSQPGMSNNPNFGPIGSGPRSAPCTPPLGPIGPPSSSANTRRSTPPIAPSPPPQQMNTRSLSDSHNAPLNDMTQQQQHQMTSSSSCSEVPSQHASSQMSEAMFHPQSMGAMSSHPSRLQSYPLASTFAGPAGTNTTFSQHSPLSSVGTITPEGSNNGNLQVVQSNLNPNAPDFSSRSSLLMAQHGPPMHHMQRLPSGPNAFQENTVPPHLAQFRPILTSSGGMSSFPMHPMPSHHPQAMNRFPIHPSQGPQQQVAEYNHNAPPGPIGSLPPGMGSLSQSADALPLLSMMGGYAPHPTQVMPGNGNMPPHHPYGVMHSIMGIRPNQRSASATPSIGTSSKEEGSPISPNASPQSSNLSSPTDLNVQENPNPAGTIGEDRKLPRPIGMERAQRKNPVFGGVSDVGGAWSLNSSGRSDIPVAGDWMQNMQELATAPPLPQEEAGLPPMLHNNYIASRYNDMLASDTSHPIEHPYQAVAGAVSGGGCFPFMNGLPPHMVAAHLYPTPPNNTQGQMEQQQIEMWNMHQKLPLSSGDGLPIEHKMTWQNWGPHQA